MDATLVLTLAREALLLMVLASAPPLLASLVVGLLAGVAQAVTQVQEVTLSVVPRLGAAVLALALAGPWIAAQLGRFTTALLLALPQVSGVSALELVRPEVLAVALLAARLAPVAFLSPLLGGPLAPATSRLGLVLALALFLRFGAGLRPPVSGPGLDALELAVGELLLGTALGLVLSLPFDAARMAGRFIDLFRGSSAEAALPQAGSREAATGDVLVQLLLALAAVGGALPVLLDALLRSYAWAPPGAFTQGAHAAQHAAALVAGAFSTALALAAPVAVGGLLVDALVGLASRGGAAPALHELAAPLRILGGGALTWLLVEPLAARLQAGALDAAEALRALAQGGALP